MSLSPDSLLDRYRLKRRLTFWRVVAVLAIVAFIGVLAGRLSGDEEGRWIARLNVYGVIVEDPWRDEALRNVLENDNIEALVVYINSPGGTVVGGEGLYESLKAIAAEKPVVAVMGEVAASGGYMAALASERIFARSGTITGSIGVIMQTAEITDLLEKIGITPVTIKSGPLKAAPNLFEEADETALAANRLIVMDMYDMFVGMVAEGRDMTKAEATVLADGRIYTGRQALANRLVDEIGAEADAITWMETERELPVGLPVFDLEYGEEGPWWGELVDAGALLLGQKGLVPEVLRVDGLLALWHPSLQ